MGFVPTMGALHEGHAALALRSIAENDITVASIFVNPTQFGPGEDLAKYPRTLEADLVLLEQLGVDAVFAPTPQDIYPTPKALHIQLPLLANRYEGASRPGHFDGVALVVSKLFGLLQPTRAYLGRKDFQQTVVLRALVEELFLPVELVVVPTVREADGLALSSRNRYLSKAERQEAPLIYQGLLAAKARATLGGSVDPCLRAFRETLETGPDFRLDYAEVVDGKTLEPLSRLAPERHPILITAAYLGTTRLLDNMPLLSDGNA